MATRESTYAYRVCENPQPLVNDPNTSASSPPNHGILSENQRAESPLLQNVNKPASQMSQERELSTTGSSLKSSRKGGKNLGEEILRKDTPLSIWRWELLTWILGTCALGLIIVLLGIFKNKPLTDWHSKVSLNALLSAISQVTQSALLVSLSSCIGQMKWSWLKEQRLATDIETFDDASRGPEGSLRLLWNQFHTHRSLHIVSLGALTTVLMIAFSPFTQQSVSTDAARVHFVESNTSGASMPRTHNLTQAPSIVGSQNWAFVNPTGSSNGLYLPLMDAPLAAAIANGVTDNYQSFSNVSGACSTGNCTWGVYNTLGLCSLESEDVTSQLNRTCKDTYGQQSCNLTIIPPLGSSAGSNSYQPASPMFEIDSFGCGEECSNFWVGSSYNGKQTLDVYVIYQKLPFYNDGTTKENLTYTALKGTLQPCVRTLNSTMINGQTNTTELNSTLLTDQCASVSGEQYCTPSGLPELMRNLAIGVFTGYVNIYPGGDNYFRGNYVNYLLLDVYGPGVLVMNPDYSQPIPGLAGFKGRLEALAISVTNGFRSRVGAQSIEGKTWIYQPYIRVDIYWLILPITLWIFATIFLWTTILISTRNSAPIWKSSPLVLLYSQKSTADIGSDRQLRETLKVEGAEIGLSRTSGMWQLEDR